MHLKRIKIDDFRNLKNFEINFTQFEKDLNTGKEKEIQTHAIIGQNGAGKSNLLEAIITIFRDIDLDNKASFDYELDYVIGRDKNAIKIIAKKDEKVKVSVNNNKLEEQNILLKNENSYLPRHIFTYYSGKNERIEKLFLDHQKKYSNLFRNGKDDLMRRLFYCRSGHNQLVLLSAMLSKDLAFKQILEDLNILELDSVLFVLKQPYYLKNNTTEKSILEGDNRFWYARGTVVEEFLDKLWNLSVAPIDDVSEYQVDFKGRTEKQKRLYLYLKDKESLEKLGEDIPPQMFFRYAEGAYIGDLIEEIRITVKHKDAKGNISFSQLSEGEVQLLMVLGLMRITNEDDCLFLLDEPDTHLNPIWKLRYFEEIEKVIKKDDKVTLQGDSQIIITTHDPMMIGSLKREQVRIMKKDINGSIIETPHEHPQGMGVSGLLKSEMFGLSSTLDRPTLELLNERNILIAKKQKDGLSDNELTRLKELKDYLEDLGFAREYRDPLYQKFIEKMFEVRSLSEEQLYSKEELEKQEALAEAIVKELVKKEQMDELSSLAKELKIELGSE
jgi:predicted ATPase